MIIDNLELEDEWEIDSSSNFHYKYGKWVKLEPCYCVRSMCFAVKKDYIGYYWTCYVYSLKLEYNLQLCGYDLYAQFSSAQEAKQYIDKLLIRYNNLKAFL